MLETPNGTRIDVDNFYNSFDRRTLGQLLRVARTKITFEQSVDDRLSHALDRRNFLAHQYFWENAQKMLTDAGRMEMMLALRDDIALFKLADDDLTEISNPLRERIGVTDEILQQEYDRMMTEADAEEIAR